MREADSSPMTGDSSVHTVHQCTCCLPRRGKPPTLKGTATMVKIHVSGDMSVSTSQRTMWGSPGYTTCTVGISISAIPVFRYASLQSTLSSPMQHPSDAMGRDNNVPIARGPVIPIFLQHSLGLPSQNMSGAPRGNTTLRAMGGHCVTTSHQNTQS